MVHYYRQKNRQSGEISGYFSVNGSPPENNHPTLLLEEITQAEFDSAISDAAEHEEEEGEPENDSA